MSLTLGTWYTVAFALPLPACLIGLVWVGWGYSRCGTGGPLAVAGLVLLVLSVTAPHAIDAATTHTTLFGVGGRNMASATVHNAALIGLRLAGGLLLVGAVMAGRRPGGGRAG